MCSRSRIEILFVVLLVVSGCHRAQQAAPEVSVQPPVGGVIASGLVPGYAHSVSTVEPQAAAYYDNAQAVVEGKRLFGQYNCSGCHSNGGGGMGPSLMDGEWIYGDRLEQIHQTLVEGRPNGMPAWGGKIPDAQLWELAAYVRSLSLPQTLAAETGNTPSQSPAPVPREAEQDAGWTPPADTTNDYGTLTTGPK
jgi:cytochrome c oxidase cbb3-type subunit III